MQEWAKKVKKFTKREQLLLFFVVMLSLATLALFFTMLTSRTEGGVCYTPECVIASNHILTTIDQKVDPCDDFYKFACGNFLKKAVELDLSSPLKPLDSLRKSSLKQLIMEERRDEAKLTKSFRDQRKFFRACMNTSAIEQNQDQSFLDDLKYVTGGWPLSQGHTIEMFWAEVMVRAREKGMMFDFFMDIDTMVDFNTSKVYVELSPPPLGNYDKNVWRDANIPKFIEMAELWGNHSVSASWEMRKTIEFAQSLNNIVAQAHNATKNMTLESQRIPISKLKTFHFPSLDWLQFLRNLTTLYSLTDNDVIILKMQGESYFKDLYYLLQKTPTKFWANYISILYVTSECRCLTKKIEQLCLEVTNALKKDVSKKDYCLNLALSTFDGVAEVEYIRRTVTNEKRQHINLIITAIKKQMENNLNKNKWMDFKTRKGAVDHLRKITSAVGWTDIVFNTTEYERVFGYNKFDLPDNNIIKMKHELSKTYYSYKFWKVKEPFSFQIKHALSVPMLEVNAFYVRYWEVLILVAPILHQPIYDLNRPQYLNYGALGSIVGHELTHAFSKNNEDIRRTYGRHTVDFWSKSTHANFEREKICLDEEYERYADEVGVRLENSTASFEENLADFTGLNLAYQAYQWYVDHFGVENQLPALQYTPNQLFWIMSSTYMCLDPKLKDPEKYYTHPEKQAASLHAFASFRVVGPIRNSPFFAKDFGCKVGSRMNPVEKCRMFV